MAERRESNRLGFHYRVELAIAGGATVEVLRPNISWGGIGFYSRDPIPDTGEVRVRITFLGRDGSAQVEEAAGRLVWSKRDGNFTAAGVAFDVTDPEAHPLLARYLRYAETFE